MDDMDKRAYSELRLEELRILGTLLQERSITRTAELMQTSQPAISKVLKHLRAQFDDPLFIRNGHAMQPTARALDISARLQHLLRAADDLRAAGNAFDPARSDRRFSLLVTDVGMIRFLPPLISRIAAVAPHVSVRAVQLDSRQFEQKLEAGDADLALGALPKAAAHLRRQRLYFDSYVSVIRKRHPALQASQSRSGFLAARHVLVTASEAGHAAHSVVERAIAAQVPAANILLRVPSFVAAAVVAGETDGIATLPANLVGRIGDPLGLVSFPPPIALPRIEISQYWHERYHRDAAHRWIRSLSFEIFSEKSVRPQEF
jgi:DNA-binding transcriptional LysR family regulator